MTTINDYLSFYWQIFNGFRINHEYTLANLRQSDIESYLDINSISILDLANGGLRPQFMILNASGSRVYGIDLVNYPSKNLRAISYSAARKIFRRQIKTFDGRRIRSTKLVCGDVEYLPYPNNSFELITSVAAFEHFLNVPKVIREMFNILITGGIAWIYIHSFTSLSGGHNVKLMEIPLHTIPRGIDAWDHLRRRQLPFHVPLNEWRIHQYLEEFSRQFEIIKHYCAMREGKHLLTPEIEAELSDYTREELTCREYVIVARKA
jgi:ubiquinone/menaquinone biosynthesis C-methylase UbiE